MLPLINKTQLSPNVSDLISGYGTGFFYSINNPSGYVTGTTVNTGLFVSTGQLANYYPKNNPSGYITGNLSKYAKISDLGILTGSYYILSNNFNPNNYFTNSNLGTTLSSYVTVATGNIQNIAISKITSNFTSTGTYLLNKLNSTGNNILGKFNTFTGSLGLGSKYASIQNLITTGSLVGSGIASLSGSLVSTGQLISNRINLLSGGLYATQSNLSLTGQTILNNIQSTGTIVNRQLTSVNNVFLNNLLSTGRNIGVQVLGQSGILNTSGRSLSSQILLTGSSLYSQTSIDIQYLTGQLSNYGSITGLNYLSNLVYSGNYQLSGKAATAGSMTIIPSGNPISQTFNTGLLSGAASASGSIFYQIQNGYAGATASSDLTLYNDLGTKFLDIGICSSQYDGTQYSPPFTVVGPNDSYMYSSSGNLAIGAIGTGVGINFFANTNKDVDISMKITSGGNVNIRKQVKLQSGYGTGFFTSGITISGYNLTSLPAIASGIATGQTILNQINSLSGTITGGYKLKGDTSGIFTLTLGNSADVNPIVSTSYNNYITSPFLPYVAAPGSSAVNLITVPINCTIYAMTWALYSKCTTNITPDINGGPTLVDSLGRYLNQAGDPSSWGGVFLGTWGFLTPITPGMNYFSGLLPKPIVLTPDNNSIYFNWNIYTGLKPATGLNGSTNVITLYCSG